MTLSLFNRTILITKISILVLRIFKINIKSNWTFNNLIHFLKEIFIIGEDMEIGTEDVQWLFNIPRLLISSTHIHKFVEFSINDSRCVWYGDFSETPETILIYFHGGGYCVGSPEAYFGLINRIDSSIKAKGLNYLLMDYPKAPEYKYPLAINICYQKYRYLTTLFPKSSFVFMGDSSGANLLLQITNKIINENIKKPKALICLSPWIITNKRDSFWTKNIDKDFLTPFAVDLATKTYLGYEITDERWDLTPLDFDYTQFPPIYLRAGENELILDEILSLIDKIKVSKCKFEYKIVKDMPHAFDIFHGLVKDFDCDFKGLLEYIKLAITI
ncbi:alpha/beta hydrolase fold [seawater metagenome]|uniref:Alpha/beta hydrolase fold n=1 Tax=seawater metagenome TaxID=1561972 RepID=A0A5E8CHG9_9ZZZZ